MNQSARRESPADGPGLWPLTPVRDALSGIHLFRASVLLGIGALVVVGVLEGSLFASIGVAALTGLVASLLLSLEADGDTAWPALQRMFWTTFGLRIVFAAATYLGLRGLGIAGPLAVKRNLPFEPAFMYVDEFTYWAWSKPYLEAWQAGSILHASLRGNAYATWPYMLGFIRFVGAKLGADTIFNARLVGCTAGALVVPYTYLTAKRLFDHRVAKLAAVLAFLLPEYWYLGASLMRDVYISLLILVVVYQVLYVSQVRFTWWRLVPILLIGLVLIPYVHRDLRYIVPPMVISCIVLARPSTRPARFLRWLLLASALLGAVALLLGTALAAIAPHVASLRALPLAELVARSQAFGQHWAHILDLQIQDRLAKASAGSLGAVLLSLPWFLRVPLSAVRLFLMPLPPWGPLLDANTQPWAAVFELASGLVSYAVLPLLPIGLWTSLGRRWRHTVWAWVPLAVMALALALIGAMMLRWRLMLMPFALILAAQGWYTRHEAPPLLARLAGLAPAGVVGLYLILKYLVPRGIAIALLGLVGLSCVMLALYALFNSTGWLDGQRHSRTAHMAADPPSQKDAAGPDS